MLRPLLVRPEVARGILKEPLPTRLLATLEATEVSLPDASPVAEVGATCFVVAFETVFVGIGTGSGAGGGLGLLILTHILVFSL
jgi:hypothetical protein|tara:strand:- start:122 stop:373 length:252 start_codon:yes stop_codon:yes gene_type:complete